jgi:hypothetical protein
VHDEIARNLKKRVGEKENAGSKSESCFGQTGIMLKRLLGETHIRAVQIRPDIEQQKERDQAPFGLVNRAF